MPRKKKVPEPGTRRYGSKSNYTLAVLEECLEKVRSGTLSAYAAAKEYKIPINTIKNKIKNRHVEKVGRPTALPEEEENIIKDHVIALADSGIPIGIDDVTLIIQRYLNSANRKVKVFKNNRPGWEWGKLFVERHQDLKTTLGQNISRNRAQVNEDKINKFFDNLESEIQNVPPENIFNFDETGFHDDPKKKKLLFRRKCRNPQVIRNSTKSCYTAVFCGTAAGEMLPPYFIFKAKNAWSDWLAGAPPGSRMTVTKSGWIDLESFDDWFKYHFLPFVIKKEGKKILICDNLSSHISVNTLRICNENNIKFVCLVPNSTHVLQPLDVGYFSSLKANWRSVLLNWRGTTRGRKTVALPKNCFTALVKNTLNLGAPQCKANLEAGFRVTGIHPLNRQEALQRLPEYAKTKVDVQTAKESLGESFKSYLAELRENDLGTKSQRKFQMPVVAGKSVSVEEVEQFYKNKAEAKNKNPIQSTNPKSSVDPKKPVKRGRPLGSKNRKKIKSQDNDNENISEQKKNAEQNTKNMGSKTKEQQEKENNSGGKHMIQRPPTKTETKDTELKSDKNPDKGNECDEIENIINQPSTSKPTNISIEMESNVDVSFEFEDIAMDLDIGNEVVIEEYLIINDTEETKRTSECAEEVKPTSVSNTSKFATILPGTTVVFRDEGCLFPGKVVSSLPPYYVVAAMTKSIGGGWKWPDKKDMAKIKFDDIVSAVDTSKIKIKSRGVYHLEDDLLFMEWGE